MNLEKQVTSLELSKKLKELGVKQESLFYWLEKLDMDDFFHKSKLVYAPNFFHDNSVTLHDNCSAFTASELSQLLPHTYTKDGLSHFIDTKSCTMSDGEYFTICNSHFYLNEDDGCAIVGDAFNGDGNEANARAMMLIYLIENGYLKND